MKMKMKMNDMDLSEFVHMAEEIKDMPPWARALLLYKLVSSPEDTLLSRWSKILMKYGMSPENVVSSVLSIFEDLILTCDA